jgi:hypothetical protein
VKAEIPGKLGLRIVVGDECQEMVKTDRYVFVRWSLGSSDLTKIWRTTEVRLRKIFKVSHALRSEG